jgi:hypothetical protein
MFISIELVSQIINDSKEDLMRDAVRSIRQSREKNDGNIGACLERSAGSALPLRFRSSKCAEENLWRKSGQSFRLAKSWFPAMKTTPLLWVQPRKFSTREKCGIPLITGV